MMKFNVAISKLAKGWTVSLPVDSERAGRVLITELHDRVRQSEPNVARVTKFRGTLKKTGKSASVVLYRSKLAQVQELIKERFLAVRRAAN